MAKIKKFAVIDTETDPFEFNEIPEPFIFGFYDGNVYEDFYNQEKFLEFCSKFDGDIYCHNGGKFDFFFFLAELIDVDIFVINGRLSKFKIGKATFLDSINILPIAQNKMKKQENFNYSKMKKENRHKYKKEIELYLRSDCENLYPFIEQFRAEYGTHLTLAKSALEYWKTNFHKKELIKSSEKYFKKFKPYYYGGRCEAFQKGSFEKDLIYVDINSAYPYVMSELQHPISIKYKTFYGSKNHNDKYMEKYFYNVVCDSDGALPVRDEKTNKISFPHIKNQEFFATGHELKAGIETDTIKNLTIKKYYEWEEYIKFKDYINHFYELKKKSAKKSPDYIFSKLFMNSLYGKFCSNPEKYKEYRIDYIDENPNKKGKHKDWKEATILNDELCVYERKLTFLERKTKYLNLATGASITGAVRAMLWRHIHMAENVFYCDTDSVICEKGIFNIGKNLGEWGIDAVIKELHIAGKKLYAYMDAYGEKYSVSKGSQLSFEEVKKITVKGSVNWKNHAPSFSMAHPSGFFVDRDIRRT